MVCDDVTCDVIWKRGRKGEGSLVGGDSESAPLLLVNVEIRVLTPRSGRDNSMFAKLTFRLLFQSVVLIVTKSCDISNYYMNMSIHVFMS